MEKLSTCILSIVNEDEAVKLLRDEGDKTQVRLEMPIFENS